MDLVVGPSQRVVTRLIRAWVGVWLTAEEAECTVLVCQATRYGLFLFALRNCNLRPWSRSSLDWDDILMLRNVLYLFVS